MPSQEKKPPYIPLDVVEFLLESYPERPAQATDSHTGLLYRGGQRYVVLHLKRLLEEQRQAALSGRDEDE